jgi:hypothetical protein
MIKALNFTVAFVAGMYWGLDIVSFFISLLVWGALTIWLGRCAAVLIHSY